MSRGLVLIADDEPEIRGFLSTLCGFFGYQSMTAGDGREAVRVASTFKPDLILMDLAMPRQDGFAAISALKASPKTGDIPIIAFSGLYVDSPIRTRLMKEGAADFLQKPINTDDLYRSMRSAMDVEEPARIPRKQTAPLTDANGMKERQHAIRRLIKFLKD